MQFILFTCVYISKRKTNFLAESLNFELSYIMCFLNRVTQGFQVLGVIQAIQDRL